MCCIKLIYAQECYFEPTFDQAINGILSPQYTKYQPQKNPSRHYILRLYNLRERYAYFKGFLRNSTENQQHATK